MNFTLDPTSAARFARLAGDNGETGAQPGRAVAKLTYARPIATAQEDARLRALAIDTGTSRPNPNAEYQACGSVRRSIAKSGAAMILTWSCCVIIAR